jgi:hypothetical protein
VVAVASAAQDEAAGEDPRTWLVHSNRPATSATRWRRAWTASGCALAATQHTTNCSIAFQCADLPKHRHLYEVVQRECALQPRLRAEAAEAHAQERTEAAALLAQAQAKLARADAMSADSCAASRGSKPH